MRKFQREVFLISIIVAFVMGTSIVLRVQSAETRAEYLTNFNDVYADSILSLHSKIDSMICRIDSLEYVARYYEPPNYSGPGPMFRNVTATMYNPVATQTDNTPFITADGSEILPLFASELRWIAVSRDFLIKYGGPFKYGDIVYLAKAGLKTGYYRITDTMNERWRNRVDILETVGTPHYKFDTVYLYKI